MAVDIWGTLEAGGKPAIDLLEYSVVSVQLEIVFGHLVTEYRNGPTALRALALYDVFCAADAPARIDAGAALPPRNLRLAQDIRRIREDLDAVAAYNDRQPEHLKRPALPARYLFDAVSGVISSGEHERMRRIGEAYDPRRTPVENLPGGRMTAGQRSFVDRVWRARIRPMLVRAGFPRISAVGG